MEKIELQFTDFLDPLYQELLLGLMVKSKDFTSRCRSIVKPGYFSSHPYKSVCISLFEYWDQFQDIPTEDLLVIAVSTKVDNPADMVAYQTMVRTLYQYAEDDLNEQYLSDQLVFFCQRAEAAYAVGTAYQDLRYFDIDKVSRTMQGIQMLPSIFTDLGMSVRDDWRSVFEQDTRTAYPTGFHHLDNCLRGAARGGELIVLWRRSNAVSR